MIFIVEEEEEKVVFSFGNWSRSSSYVRTDPTIKLKQGKKKEKRNKRGVRNNHNLSD